MPLIELPMLWILAIDILAWAVFHIVISLLTLSLPDALFTKDSFLFQTRKWEWGGELWQRLFKVKLWKDYIPDGTAILGRGYHKKRLHGTAATSLGTFILETRRAELTHWLSILPAGFFFIWNPVWAGWVMVGYAFIFNLPIIIVQRYNRPRLQRLVNRKRNILFGDKFRT